MFTHLHAHTHFSFGIGVSSPEVLAGAAAERGFRALACTDTNGVYGAVEFQRACTAAGVRHILGAHLVADRQEVVALAVDERGWGSLCRAITRIHWSTSGARTGVPVEEGAQRGVERGCQARPDGAGMPVRAEHLSDFLLSLAHDREGLILISRDVGLLEEALRLSGPQNLYAELRPGKARHAVLAAARRLGLPAVATNGVIAARPEDWSRHRLLRAIALNTTLSATPSEEIWPTHAWLCTGDDLARHFPDCPEAMRQAEEIAERCAYTIPVGQRIVPPRIADTGSAFAQLRELTLEGARWRYPAISRELQDRLDLELGIIAQKGFADYFLVVRDIVRHGPTHCGRGSVANSVVSYCLGITHVDPISSKLIFERFLNLERSDPPDIDLDFPWDERDQILEYVFRRYPRLHSAMVANHNCFQPRSALREVAKVHGRPAGEIREVTRRIPYSYETGDRLPHIVATHPNLRGLHLADNWQEFARIAEGLVGIPRHLSVHAGGVVITPTPLTDYVPVERAAKTLPSLCSGQALPVPVIQFEKDGTEDAGLVKIDLLGNRSLAVIRDAIEAVHGHTSHQIDYTSSTAGDDEAAKELFRTGKTMGVFYTESPASRLLCAKSQADTFELLVLNTSMIRPASNKYIKLYLERLRNQAPYEPLDPSLRDTLADSFGIMVYQEDVVNVCATFAGMSPATGDGLRKALSKKRPAKHLGAYAEEFFTGAVRLGRDPDVAKRVWEMIMSFAGYSFCKGHSCSYIQIAQHSCALRANHPAEFMAAVLSNGGGFYQPFAYVAEAMRMGLTVLPPDVNASNFRCIGKDREIRIGLQFVKGLSADAVERVLAARADRRAGGQADRCWDRRSQHAGELSASEQTVRPSARPPARPFTSIFDLRARTGIAPSDLRLLIKVGALDSIANGWTRPMMLWLVDAGGRSDSRSGGRSKHTAELRQSEQTVRPSDRTPVRPPDWFDDLPAAVPTLKEYSIERRRREEYEALGFICDAHPMQLYTETLQHFRPCLSIDLHRHAGRHVLAAGMLTTAKPVHTKAEEPMEFVTFDDGHGLIEAVLFPGIYRERGNVLFDQGPFIFRGKVEEEFGAVTLTITHLDRLERARVRSRQ